MWESPHRCQLHKELRKPLDLDSDCVIARAPPTQGKYDESEPLYRDAMEVTERNLGTSHPLFAQRLNNLADLLYHQVRSGNASGSGWKEERLRDDRLLQRSRLTLKTLWLG